MGINWDTAGYATDIGRGGPWASNPWNSHFGVGQVYWLAMHLAKGLGSTGLNGIRALNALALALTVAGLVKCGTMLGLKPAQALITSLVYIVGWGTLWLAFTWEDNILVHPAAVAALACCLAHIDNWKWRHGLIAGFLVGIASLMSWQGAAYLLPVLYAPLAAGGDRPWWARLRDTLLAPLGLVLGRATWVFFYWVSASGLSLRTLFRTAFERPSPNYLPADLAGWIALAGKPGEILKHLGIGVTHELGPWLYDSPTVIPYLSLLGACFFAVVLGLWIASALFLRKISNCKIRFLSFGLFAVTLASMVYLDLPGDKYKRYDYLPIFASLGLAAFVYFWERRTRSLWFQRFLWGSVLLFVFGVGFLGYRWNRQWYARLPTSKPIDYAGFKSQTWFSYFRGIHEQHPDACSFVFAFSEVSHSRYQLEIPASLYSELPNPIVIGAPATVSQWPRPLPIGDINHLRTNRHGCEWISPQAMALLAPPK
jgi:4-amino-4-deoxy-L-arabinose transferase-like glycosyltransferase